MDSERHILIKKLTSEFPYEQMKGLNDLKKDVINIHPFIRYTLLKEIVFKTINADIKLQLAQIAYF